ncbi:c-SKI Smad4 binding domain protein [Oesophagostomum dentatum]|uniref:C-SKI Smad4 binding domain protein n=1 Tax=Oesophagostomum dentatum TaxID=61180 RepID=A0A0B1TH79_OESDE|nr:c-SKI Smad4 binding domain protein [Oesophagostomum dentatum]
MATVTQDAAHAVDPLLYRLPEFPAAIPIAPTPAMSPCDSDGIAAWITISGGAFPAMVLGGEPRIPVNLLLSRVLLSQGVSEIQTMMDDLNIHKSIATNEQAERLRKMDPDVSHDIAALSLVTRTDAERICGIVRIESDPAPDGEADVDESERLSVQHQLFGTVNGWVYPSRKGGRSVRCRECECFFTPEDFVAHSHTDNRESQRTVHWGFDPANWRFMLELVKPSSESAACQERWKQFVGEKTDCSRKISEESNPINKAKRSIADQIEEVPLKVARSSTFGAKSDPFYADASSPLKAHLRDSLSRFFGSMPVDPLALLSDTMQKETAFKVKSLAGISEQPSSSGVGQLIKLDRQPMAAVPDPSAFMLVDENLLRIKSSCDKLEAVEFALKQSASADPAIMATLRDVRACLSENNGAEYRRLRNAYEFLFALYRQSCDPLGCSNDPLVRAAIATMRADQIALGVAMNTNPKSVVKGRQYSDLVQASTDAFSMTGKFLKRAHFSSK